MPVRLLPAKAHPDTRASKRSTNRAILLSRVMCSKPNLLFYTNLHHVGERRTSLALDRGAVQGTESNEPVGALSSERSARNVLCSCCLTQGMRHARASCGRSSCDVREGSRGSPEWLAAFSLPWRLNTAFDTSRAGRLTEAGNIVFMETST